MGNYKYKDGPQVERVLQDALEKEEADGPVAEAFKRYPGSSLRIAALAVINNPDPPGGSKK